MSTSRWCNGCTFWCICTHAALLELSFHDVDPTWEMIRQFFRQLTNQNLRFRQSFTISKKMATSTDNSFRLIYDVVSNGKIPVRFYKSSDTQLSVAIAQIEGPLVNGYFCLGELYSSFFFIFLRTRQNDHFPWLQTHLPLSLFLFLSLIRRTRPSFVAKTEVLGIKTDHGEGYTLLTEYTFTDIVCVLGDRIRFLPKWTEMDRNGTIWLVIEPSFKPYVWKRKFSEKEVF